MRRRSLFQRPHSSTVVTASETSPPLAQASALLREVRKLFGPTSSTRPTSSEPATSPTPQRQIPTSPPINTPSKLKRYLEYAEKHLGVNNATTYERRLARESFGPDIILLINDQLLVDCGVPMGDAIRLKRGSSSWWASPEAKRPRVLDNPTNDDFFGAVYDIRFEKRFREGGSMSVFGSGLRPGRNRFSKRYHWFYYNSDTSRVEPVPPGFIPELDPQFLDIHAPEEESDEESDMEGENRSKGSEGGDAASAAL